MTVSMCWQRLIFFSVLLTCVAAHADQPPLRILLNSKLAEPYYFFAPASGKQTKRPTLGILVDIQQELAQELKRRPLWTQLPRAQLENAILHGMADVQCAIDKRWVQNRDDYLWTDTLLTASQVVVVNDPAIHTLSDLKGKRIGTILLYRYPDLEAQIGVATWQRDDADADLVNLKKLSQQRLDAVIITQWALQYWQKTQPSLFRQTLRSLALNEQDLRCIVSPNNAILQHELNVAIAALQQRRHIQTIIRRYTH